MGIAIATAAMNIYYSSQNTIFVLFQFYFSFNRRSQQITLFLPQKTAYHSILAARTPPITSDDHRLLYPSQEYITIDQYYLHTLL